VNADTLFLAAMRRPGCFAGISEQVTSGSGRSGIALRQVIVAR
jgi:hypothetical protein